MNCPFWTKACCKFLAVAKNLQHAFVQNGRHGNLDFLTVSFDCASKFSFQSGELSFLQQESFFSIFHAFLGQHFRNIKPDAKRLNYNYFDGKYFFETVYSCFMRCRDVSVSRSIYNILFFYLDSIINTANKHTRRFRQVQAYFI